MRLTQLAVIAASTTLVAVSVQAQPVVAPKTNVLSIQPLTAILGVYSAEWEHVVTQTMTFGIGGSFWSNNDDYAKTAYTSGDLKLRYYPEGTPLRGFSLGVQAGYTSVSDDVKEESFFGLRGKHKLNAPSIGVGLEYGWLLGVSKSLYVGLGVGAKKILTHQDEVPDATLGYPTGRVSVGYAF